MTDKLFVYSSIRELVIRLDLEGKVKKALRVVAYAVLAVSFSILFSGCGKQAAVDPSASKIVVWSFESPDVWVPIQKSFEKANKGYTLVYQQQTFDATYENRALNSILAGQGPDVWAMPNDWVYRHKEKLAPMPDTLNKTIVIDKFVPAVKDSVVIDGKVMAVAPAVEPLVLFYNPALITSAQTAVSANKALSKEQKTQYNGFLTKFSQTWTDFTEAAKLLTVKNGSVVTQAGVAMGTSAITSANDLLYLLMLQNGTEIVADGVNQATYGLPVTTAAGAQDYPGARALDFYASFADPNSANYTWSDSLGNDVSAFGQGKVAFLFGTSRTENVFLQDYPFLKYRKNYVPQVNVESDKIKDYAIFNAFGVTKSSKSGVAWGALSALSATNITDYSSATRKAVSTKKNNYDISIKNRDGSNPESLELATAKSLVKGRYPLEFDSFLRKAIDSVNAKTNTSQGALDLASNKATELLRQETW